MPKKTGSRRQSVYPDSVAADILRRLAEGETLRAICRDDGMPSHNTVLAWQEDPVFADQYARSRAVGYQVMADQLVEIADDGTNDSYRDDDGNVRTDHDVIARSRLRVDTRKWLLSKALPKIYGDRLTAELVGKDGGPIKTEATVVDASGMDADDRAALRAVLKAAKGRSE